MSAVFRLRPDHADLVRGAVLLSGLYGFEPVDAKDERYYGAPETYADKSPRQAVVDTALPLLVACSQYDPARFQAEFLGLMQARLAAHGTMPRAILMPGHNHYTLAMHLGTSDKRLEEEIAAFLEDIL
jgi:hypothetical protein